MKDMTGYFIICDSKSGKINKSFRPFGTRKAAEEAIAKRISSLAKAFGTTIEHNTRLYSPLFIIKKVEVK